MLAILVVKPRGFEPNGLFLILDKGASTERSLTLTRQALGLAGRTLATGGANIGTSTHYG